MAERPVTSQQAGAKIGRPTAGGDRQAIVARYRGQTASPAYARLVRSVCWHAGDAVSFSTELWLPPGFHRRIEGQVALMRWDDFPLHPRAADYSGIAIDGDDRRARLVLQRHGVEVETVLAGPFRLPEGRWFRLEVRQLLSPNREALNEVRIDGETVAESMDPNMHPSRDVVRRVRFGLVAISLEQRRGLRLKFAGASASTVASPAR